MVEKFISQQSHRLAREAGLNPNQEQVIKYSISILSTTFFGYIAIGVIGALNGFFVPSLVAVFSTSFLRMFSGGAHASTPLRCVMIGAGIFPALGWVSSLIPSSWIPVLLGLTVLAGSVLLGLFAPADTPAKPIESKLQRKRLKIISFSLLYLWGFLIWLLTSWEGSRVDLINSSILGVIWQVFSITPLGYKTLGLLEMCIDIISRIGKSNKLRE